MITFKRRAPIFSFVAVGADDELARQFADRLAEAQVIDAKGKTVTPGLVDPHTRLVYAGSREHEWTMRLHGATYMEIMNAGGGIHATTKATREASEEMLYEESKRRLDQFLLHGVTTVEAKSGYGLSLEHEIKQLEVAKRLDDTHPVDIVSTFLGAHAVPPEWKHDPDEYVRLVIDEMIPEVSRRGFAEFNDVFCERGVFTPDQARLILEAGKEHGLTPKIHADEIEPYGGAELAAEVGAISADHLLRASDEGIRRMADGGVIGVLLPGTAFFLMTQAADARRLIDAVASFVGSYSIGLLITNKVFKEGKYTVKEAAIIATGFSTVSVTFMVVVAKTLGLMPIWNTYFWVTFLVTFAVTAFTARLWPLSRMSDEYYDGKGDPEQKVTGSYMKQAWAEAMRAVEQSKGIGTNIWENLRDGFIMMMGILPSIMSVGLIGLLLAEYTPVFDWLGYLFYPFTLLLQIPEPLLAAKASAIEIAEMFLPALLVTEAPLVTKFIIAVVSVSAILFFSAVIPCILSTEIPLSLPRLLVIWFERTALTLILTAPLAYWLL